MLLCAHTTRRWYLYRVSQIGLIPRSFGCCNEDTVPLCRRRTWFCTFVCYNGTRRSSQVTDQHVFRGLQLRVLIVAHVRCLVRRRIRWRRQQGFHRRFDLCYRLLHTHVQFLQNSKHYCSQEQQ